MRAGIVEAVGDDPLAEAAGEAAREGDDPLAVLRDDREVDGRLAAVQAVEEARARELDEVAVADVARRDEREVVVLVASARRLVVDEVDLAADDRLDAVLAGGEVVLDGAVHDPVVGETQRRLAERRRPRGEGIDLARPVQQRVLRMDVKVRAGGDGHERMRICTGADGPAAVPARCGGCFVTNRAHGPATMRSKPADLTAAGSMRSTWRQAVREPEQIARIAACGPR